MLRRIARSPRSSLMVAVLRPVRLNSSISERGRSAEDVEMPSQGVLQACLASQMTVANIERRNAAGMDLKYRRLCSTAARHE